MNRCCNYIICENMCEYNICQNCYMFFGKWRGRKEILDIKEEENCNICNNIGLSISRPDCDHFLCIKCFKQIYTDPYITVNNNFNKLSEYLDYNHFIKKCNKCHLKT